MDSLLGEVGGSQRKSALLFREGADELQRRANYLEISYLLWGERCPDELARGKSRTRRKKSAPFSGDVGKPVRELLSILVNLTSKATTR